MTDHTNAIARLALVEAEMAMTDPAPDLPQTAAAVLEVAYLLRVHLAETLPRRMPTLDNSA